MDRYNNPDKVAAPALQSTRLLDQVSVCFSVRQSGPLLAVRSHSISSTECAEIKVDCHALLLATHA